MELELTNVKLYGNGKANPKQCILMAGFEAEFGPKTAKALNCKEAVIANGTSTLRPFKFYGLRLEIAQAIAGFQLLAGKKIHEFPCTVRDFEVLQSEKNVGVLRFNLVFAQKRLEAFSMLYSANEGPGAFQAVYIKGQQRELFEESEEQDAEE